MSPTPEFTDAQLLAARATAWHQAGEPLLTLEAARNWVASFGLVLFAPRAQALGAPAPSFVEATLGTAESGPTAAQSETALNLLARMVSEGSAVPLNLLGGPGDVPDFVASAQVFSFCYTLRGDKAWKQPPSQTGAVKVSTLALRVFEALTERGAMTAHALASDLGREVTDSAIVRALGELWSQMRVLPRHAGAEGTIWELTTQRFSKAVKAGSNAGVPTALSALVSLYLHQATGASEDEVESFLSPLTARSRIREVVHALSSARELETVAVDGKTLLYVADALPEFAAIETPAEPVIDAEQGEHPGTSDDGRITRFEGAGARGSNLRGKPVRASAGRTERSRPAAPRAGSAGSGERPAAFTRPWEEDRRPRPEASGDARKRTYKPRTEGASDRPARTYKPRTEGASDRPARTYKPRTEGASDRPTRTYTPRTEGASDRPARTFKPRAEGSSDRPSRPFTPRGEGASDRPARPYRPRTEGSGDRPSRPFTPRGEGASDRPARTFRPRTQEGDDRGAARTFRPSAGKTSRPGAFRRDASEGADRSGRPYARKSPTDDAGSRPFSSEARPFRPRTESREGGNPYSARKDSGPRPGARPGARPGGFSRPERSGSSAGGERTWKPRADREGSARPYAARPSGDRPFQARSRSTEGRAGGSEDRPKFGAGSRFTKGQGEGGADRGTDRGFPRGSRSEGRPGGSRGGFDRAPGRPKPFGASSGEGRDRASEGSPRGEFRPRSAGTGSGAPRSGAPGSGAPRSFGPRSGASGPSASRPGGPRASGPRREGSGPGGFGARPARPGFGPSAGRKPGRAGAKPGSRGPAAPRRRRDEPEGGA